MTADDDEDDPRIERAVALARSLLTESIAGATRSERRRQGRLGALLEDPEGRELIFALTDEVLRLDRVDSAMAARRFADVVQSHPTRAVGVLDRLLLRSGSIVAPRLPSLVMPMVLRRIKRETHGIVLPADDPGFAKHVARRGADGVRLNVNPLGESILSDAEADERMRVVCERVARPDVDYVSVKVSAVVANLDALAFDHSVDRICDRLRDLYRAANAATPVTFVNLDMEEYRDLELTLAAFMRVLAEPEFVGLDAGIVLQAYLPDSHDALDRLGRWAALRHAGGGGRIKVRLVKGANLAMERVEAELHGWIQAPYSTKAEVDASYKALLDAALSPEFAEALRVGLASHNLFDVAWALVIGAEYEALDRIDFEMLEGMAPAQSRVVHGAAGNLLMYAPVVADRDFDASIAYLSRRLDENTQPENFLRALFSLTPDSVDFDAEANRFRVAVRARHAVSKARHRAPRRIEPPETGSVGGFVNQAESDATDEAFRTSLGQALATPPTPSYEHVDSIERVDEIVAVALAAFGSGGGRDRQVARQWLLGAADLMAAEHAATLGLMAAEVAKIAREGDPEIAEAIDFCRYYATVGSTALDTGQARGIEVRGRGVVVVVAPWNFPYAIAIGGVAAALAAGNTVILKPAPEAVRIGARIVDQFHRAGVPPEVLQLVVCDDGPVGARLITHPGVDTVVLTGSYETAAMFLDWRPDLRLLAETSGKNALIVTPSADLDQAIADLVRSAFGHAGQKCSAASLGIVLAEVYDDASFQRRLRDAVASVRVGPAADLSTMMGPLVAPAQGPLLRALTAVDPGESWLVEPRRIDDRTWTPGVRLDVAPGSWFHRTECFGPVLGLMRAVDLDDAIAIANATEFGLTGGIHSLDERDVERWLAGVEVGNGYVNRHITGAVVQRQPFGGWKRSSVGGGRKAGGPGYVAQFAHVTDPADPPPLDVLRDRFDHSWRSYFALEHDLSRLQCEANILRYRSLGCIVLRHDNTDGSSVAIARMAAATAGVTLIESDERSESEDALLAHLDGRGVARVRLLGSLSDSTRRHLHHRNIAIDTAPLLSDPDLELHHWVREQSIARTLHRHGRLVGE